MCHLLATNYAIFCLTEKREFSIIQLLRQKQQKLSGAIAQLVERLHGMQEAVGSIPTSSTIKSLSSRGLGHCPFTAATGVRIPVGTPYLRSLHHVMQAFLFRLTRPK